MELPSDDNAKTPGVRAYDPAETAAGIFLSNFEKDKTRGWIFASIYQAGSKEVPPMRKRPRR